MTRLGPILPRGVGCGYSPQTNTDVCGAHPTMHARVADDDYAEGCDEHSALLIAVAEDWHTHQKPCTWPGTWWLNRDGVAGHSFCYHPDEAEALHIELGSGIPVPA